MAENKHTDIEGATPQALLERAYHLESLDDALALYRDWAGSYEDTMVDGLGFIAPRLLAARLARHLKSPDRTVLDVGCGTGLAGAALTALGHRALDGLDISPEMLREAGERGIYRTLIEADLTKTLPIETAAYGAALSSGTFTHAHVGAEALDEILRVVKPGGVFACTIHRDVFEPMGFAEKLQAFGAEGRIRMIEIEDGPYFETSEEPEGKYAVIERL